MIWFRLFYFDYNLFCFFQDSLSSDQSECIRPPPPKPHKHKRQQQQQNQQQQQQSQQQQNQQQNQLPSQQQQQQFRAGGPDYDPYSCPPDFGSRSGFSRIRPYGVSSSDDEIRSTPECTSCGEEEIESESVSEKGRNRKKK